MTEKTGGKRTLQEKGLVNEHKRTEEALRKSEGHLRLALEAAKMGTWNWDMLTNEMVWSSGVEEIFRLPAGSFKGTYEAYEI